jgi:hypothetical protein
MLPYGLLQSANKLDRQTRFYQETKDLPFVDSVDARLQIGVSCQHHAHRVGRCRGSLAEHFDPIHARHAEVRDDHCELLTAFEPR